MVPFQGHFSEGFTILAEGSLIIAMLDNLLRPFLIGKEIQMHPFDFSVNSGRISIFVVFRLHNRAGDYFAAPCLLGDIRKLSFKS